MRTLKPHFMGAVMADFLADVAAAETALRDLFPATPLQLNDHLSARYGAEIWLKREDLTPVRSYKLRGAFNAMRKAIAAASDATTLFSGVLASDY